MKLSVGFQVSVKASDVSSNSLLIRIDTNEMTV